MTIYHTVLFTELFISSPIYEHYRQHSICLPSRQQHFTISQTSRTVSMARAERDGTRAETRFRLSPKRTSPFKSVGASVQSTAGSRGVRISLSNA